MFVVKKRGEGPWVERAEPRPPRNPGIRNSERGERIMRGGRESMRGDRPARGPAWGGESVGGERSVRGGPASRGGDGSARTSARGDGSARGGGSARGDGFVRETGRTAASREPTLAFSLDGNDESEGAASGSDRTHRRSNQTRRESNATANTDEYRVDDPHGGRGRSQRRSEGHGHGGPIYRLGAPINPGQVNVHRENNPNGGHGRPPRRNWFGMDVY